MITKCFTFDSYCICLVSATIITDQAGTQRVQRAERIEMRWDILLGLVLLACSTKAVTKDAGNCEAGLRCNAFLRLRITDGTVMLVGGFSITSLSPSSVIGASTKGNIAKNSAFKYHALGQDLITALKADLTRNKCDERLDLVALALYDSATRVSKNCAKIDAPECSHELPVLTCGNPVSGAIIPMPWESLLSPLSSMFDNDGSNFDIFTALIRDAAMESLLVGAKDITLLAPNDEAFGRSARYMGSYLGDPTNEKAVYEAFKTMAKDGMMINGVAMPGDELIRFFLAYHILSDQQAGKNFNGMPRSMTTASTVFILSIGTKEIVDISSATPNAKVLQSDISIEGGVLVHSIDAVLIPFEVSVDLMSSFDCKMKMNTQLEIIPNPSLEASVAPRSLSGKTSTLTSN